MNECLGNELSNTKNKNYLFNNPAKNELNLIARLIGGNVKGFVALYYKV